MNTLLSLAFILTLTLQHHGYNKINTPEHTIYSLAATDWYTPKARRQLFRFPVSQAETGGNLARYTGAAIEFRTGYWDGPTYQPIYAFVTMMHEFNHYFDFSSPARPGADPEFCAASLAITNYPSVSTWHLADQSCVERYAYVGEYPWLYPELRKFYPQFSDIAYSRPQRLP